MRCPYCGEENDEGSLYCEYCGSELEKKSNKKSIYIILSLIFVLVILVSGYFVYDIFFNGSNNVVENHQTEEVVKQGTEDTTDSKNSNSSSEKSNEQEGTIQLASNFNKITASSTREPVGSNGYDCNNLIDKNNTTAWVEGVTGDGIGEYVLFSADGIVSVNAIRISNGYHKSKDLYYKNNRIKNMRLEFSDGTFENVYFKDDFDLEEDIKFVTPKQTAYVKMIIESVYSGSKYDDTCINEVSFY